MWNAKAITKAILVIVMILGVGQAAIAQAGACSDNDVLALEGKRHELTQVVRNKLIEYAEARKRNEPSDHQFEMYKKANSDMSAVNSEIANCAKTWNNAIAMHFFANELIRNGDMSLKMVRTLEDSKALDLSIKEKLQEDANNQFAAAVEWYRKSADKGVIGAMYELGSLHAEGKGGSKSLFIAVEWYSKAATKSLSSDPTYRDFPVACLEKMTQLAPSHPLTVALTKKLYGETKQ